MLISPEGKFAFIHVPRTAGTSIRAALRPAVPVSIFELFQWHARSRDCSVAIYEWESYYSFAFVRNPWDMQASMFRYIHALGNAHPEWIEVSKFRTVNDYLDRYIQPRWERGNIPLQSEFVTDSEGRQIVSFVGRFEHLQEHFSEICTRIGLAPKLLERKNSSGGPHYSEVYNGAGKRLIDRMYRKDIDRFEYMF